MRKIFVSTMAVGLLVFSGCDLLIDATAVHNGLVDSMDNVLRSEENFYNEYWALVDGADTTPFLESVEEFRTAVVELDTFFTDTKFHSSQQIFIEEYNEYYKPFVDEYIEDVNEFAEKVEDEGFVYENFESMFPAIDQHTIDFIDIHNDLIGTVNVQSDFATDGASY